MARNYDSETYGLKGMGFDSSVYGFDSMFERPAEDRDFDWTQALQTMHKLQDADNGKAFDFLSYEEMAAGLQGKSMHDFYADNFDRLMENMTDAQKLGLAQEMSGLDDTTWYNYTGGGVAFGPAMDQYLTSENFANYMVNKNAADRGMSAEEYESNIRHAQEVVFENQPGDVKVGMYSDDAALTDSEKYNRDLDNAYGSSKDEAAAEEAAGNKEEDEVAAEEAAGNEEEDEVAGSKEEAEVAAETTEAESGDVYNPETGDMDGTATEGSEQAVQEAADVATGTAVEENAPVAGEYGTQGAGTAKEDLRPSEWNSDSISEYADKMKEGGFISENTANLIKTLAPVLDSLGLSGAFGNMMANAFEKWGGNSEEMWTEGDVFDAQQEAYNQVAADQMDAGESYQSEQVAEAGDYVATDAPDAGSSAHIEGLPVPEANHAVDEQTHAAEKDELDEAADAAEQEADLDTVEEDADAAKRYEYAEWANNLYDEEGNMSVAPEPELPDQETVAPEAGDSKTEPQVEEPAVQSAGGAETEPADEQTPAEVAADACEDLGKGDVNIEDTGHATAPEVIEEPAAAEQVAEQAVEAGEPEVAAVESVETAGAEVAADVAEDTVGTAVDVAEEALPDEVQTEWDYGQGGGGAIDYGEETAADALGSDADYTAGDAVTIDVEEPTGQHEAENDLDITG